MKTEFSRNIFEKSSYSTFHENPSNGIRVIPCGRTDMTKLTVAFRNFANVPKVVIIQKRLRLILKKTLKSITATMCPGS